MPQKKNPDIAELIRGKTGRVYGDLMGLLTMMKGIPLAYDKDIQEDKEASFDAIDTVSGCIRLMTGQLATIKFITPVMNESAAKGFTNATDLADYLVGKGVPFRDAHSYVGRIVLLCIDKDCAIDDLSLEELRGICPSFEEDVYEAISIKTCIDRRNTKGAPGPDAMKEEIEEARNYLNKEETIL
jgi:argininosuccinate lyase